MAAAVYRNTGAPWTRDDGTRVERGAEFCPGADELLRRAYKLVYVRACEDDCPDLAAAPVAGRNLDDYAVGGGWYLIDGEKVQGRDAAAARLEALV
jgi:hypothetical protein